MKSRIVHSKFFSDSFIRTLKPLERYLFLYFLTNEHINIIHLYECPDDVILFESGVDQKTLEVFKEKIGATGKILFYQGYVLLRNADKYETYVGEKNLIAKSKLFEQLPSSVLDWYNKIKDTPIDTPIEGVYIPTINHKSEIINHKLKTLTINYEKIISVFNERFGSSYQLTEGRKEKIRIRLKTFTEEQIIAAIIGMSQNKFYQGDNKTGWKADPDYLLRSDEIIDRFINSKISGKSIADMVREAQQ